MNIIILEKTNDSVLFKIMFILEYCRINNMSYLKIFGLTIYKAVNDER